MRSVDSRASTPSEAPQEGPPEPDEQLVPEPATDPAPQESPPEPVGDGEITTSDT